MELVKQTTLHFRQGKSDKVYEVDLCEVASGQFVVNFRYGRRGSTLREGTKTTTPLPRDAAEAVFDELVESKTSKGYSESPVGTSAAAQSEPLAVNTDARKEATLKRIREGRVSNSSWKLSRAIWRAGELKIEVAEPLLHGLVGKEVMTDYCIAWTMGRLGLAASTPVLQRIAETALQDHLKQMASQALRQAAPDKDRSALISQAIDGLPDPLRSFLRNESDEAFKKTFLDGVGKQYDADLLNALYYIDSPTTRDTLLQALQEVPLQPPFFRAIRRIFKAAEMRRDGQIFGVLAHRFEVFTSKYRVPSYHYRNYVKPMLGDTPEHAFSVQTRTYFRRRIWWVLNRLGEIGDSDFVPMAVGTLLPFTDDEAKPVRTDTRYNWQNNSYTYVHWDPFGSYWAFSNLLYRNSRRYQPTKGRTSFQVVDGGNPNAPPVAGNEAAYPKLWQDQPRGLLHLLIDSRCLPVHQFAVKAIRPCTEFCNEIPTEVISMLLGSAYEVTNEFAFDLAVQRYDANNPDFDLVLALANCQLDKARQRAKTWIENKRNVFFADTDFAYQIMTSPFADTRRVAVDSLHALPNDESNTRVLAGRLVAFMQGATAEQAEIADDVGNALMRPAFKTPISVLGEDVICDLLKSEVAEVQMFAGNVVVNHEHLAKAPTEQVLRAMLDATHSPVRSMAIKIISELPDEILLKNVEMLAGLCCHDLEDIRNEVRPIIKRLSEENAEFSKQISAVLIRRLLTPGAPEGVPTHTSQVLRQDFEGKLEHVPPETVLKLLHSRSAPAQEVGGFLLPTNVDPLALSVVEIVQLTKHPVLVVRQASWRMYTEQSDRMRSELATAVRILDSSWEDSRQFGFQFFDERTSEQDLTCDVLISICDSVRDDVQQFGRSMITRHFKKEDGPDYLLKLSEHPSADLQLFATNFLAEHGKDHPDRISQMSPYFVSILSRVNKSRVAKDRVLQFLEEEAVKNQESAQTISKVLARISATCAIGDRAKTIEAMLALNEVYPDIELPISTKTMEVR